MAKTDTNDTYRALDAYGNQENAHFVKDLSIGPGKGFVKLVDSTSGVDLTAVRALLFTTPGTITLTDSNGHVESNVAVLAGQTIICEFIHASDIACTVYAIT